MRRCRSAAALLRPLVTVAAAALVALGASGCASSSASRRSGPAAGAAGPVYEVYAIRYATVRGFPAHALVAGADTTRKMDIAMMVWLLRGPNGRNVLVDAGFYRDKFVDRWKPADYRRPSEAIGALGLRPEDITDVIVTHVHWDHLDGADLFPKARIWIQKDEFLHYVNKANGMPRAPAIDTVDAKMLDSLWRAGRVSLVPGDSQTVLPGITAFTGGKHTYASQFVTVRTARGMVVLASDNAYLYENFDRHVPIAQTIDTASNLRAQERMTRLATDRRLIVPGHDPLVFKRFRKPGHGVAKIE